MVRLQIPKQQKLVKTASRGNYSEEQKQQLLNLTGNITLELKALASKWNRDFTNVRRVYYRLQESKKKIINDSKEESIIPKFSAAKSKENVSKFNPIKNAWTEFEDELVIEALENSNNKSKAARDLEEVLDNRSVAAILTRWKILQKKKKDNSTLDTSFIGIPKESSSFIPETSVPTFLKQEQVTMYRAELSDSLHEKAQDAVKANIRAIIDSIPSSEATDEQMHRFFYENQDKIKYMLETNVDELW